MVRLIALLFVLIPVTSLVIAQSGSGGNGGNSLQAQVEELYRLVNTLQEENAALRGSIESNTSGITQLQQNRDDQLTCKLNLLE
jgi:hypothetical protein